MVKGNLVHGSGVVSDGFVYQGMGLRQPLLQHAYTGVEEPLQPAVAQGFEPCVILRPA